MNAIAPEAVAQAGRGAGFEELDHSAPDGLRLHARIYGAAHRHARLPVVCLPGLTRNSRDFHELAMLLSAGEEGRMVVAFDYRGRGRSEYDRDWRRYDLQVETDDILAGLAVLDLPHAAFIGTSRGGLILHLIAAQRPAILKAVVLNDIGPQIEGEGLAQIRTALKRAPTPASWQDAADSLRVALGGSFPALTASDWQRMARAIYRENERGRIVPDHDPALVNTILSVDLSRPLPSLWQQFMGFGEIPLLLIRGEHSRLLSADTAARMGELHPRMQLVTVRGQGHPPMLETGELPSRILEFLASAVHA